MNFGQLTILTAVTYPSGHYRPCAATPTWISSAAASPSLTCHHRNFTPGRPQTYYKQPHQKSRQNAHNAAVNLPLSKLIVREKNYLSACLTRLTEQLENLTGLKRKMYCF